MCPPALSRVLAGLVSRLQVRSTGSARQALSVIVRQLCVTAMLLHSTAHRQAAFAAFCHASGVVIGLSAFFFSLSECESRRKVPAAAVQENVSKTMTARC